MAKFIVFDRADGGVSIFNPAPSLKLAAETEDAFLARVMQDGTLLPAGAINPRVVTEDEALALTVPPPPTYREQRAAAYIAQIPTATPEGFQGAAGDSIDAIQKQVRLLTAAVKALDPNFVDDPDYVAWDAKVEAIKTAYPKP